MKKNTFKKGAFLTICTLILNISIAFSQTWQALSFTYSDYASNAKKVFASPLDNTVIMAYKAHSQHTGSYDSHISFDGGDNWQPIFSDKGVRVALFAPNGNNYLFTTKWTQFGEQPDTLFRSPDGINWTNLGTFSGSGVTNQNEGDYFVTGNNTLFIPAVLNGPHLLKSTDNGASWSPKSNIGDDIRSVVASYNGDTIIVGTNNSGIRYSHDGGATFATSVGASGGVHGLAFLPNGDVYTAGSKSTNGGATFTAITWNPFVAMNVTEFLYHPPSGKFFTSAVQGIFESPDCITWTNITGNLTDAFSVVDMAISQNYLYVAKYSDDNLYRYEIQGGVTGISEAGEENNFLIYPNPANQFVTVGNTPIGSTVNIFDITGKTVYNVVVKNENTRINTEAFVNGIYTLQIENNGGLATKKFVISR